jgi:hypothetical protein
VGRVRRSPSKPELADGGLIRFRTSDSFSVYLARMTAPMWHWSTDSTTRVLEAQEWGAEESAAPFAAAALIR